MNRRVEVIPASAMEFITLSYVGASTYQFMEEKNEYWQALSVFCLRYDPADEDDATDFFSSREIQDIVAKHTGIHIDLTELHNLMIEMKYKYFLLDDEFKWRVKKL